MPREEVVKLKLSASSKLSTNFALRSSSLVGIPNDSSAKPQRNSFKSDYNIANIKGQNI